MRILAGWVAIVLVLVAMIISIVPGAISVMGLAMSMLAVVIALFSIKQNGRKYFDVTVGLALVGLFLVNDSLRVWASLPVPLTVKFVLYSIAALVLSACSLAAYRLGSATNDPDKRASADQP